MTPKSTQLSKQPLNFMLPKQSVAKEAQVTTQFAQLQVSPVSKVTGLCSNYEQNFAEQLTSNLNTILRKQEPCMPSPKELMDSIEQDEVNQ